MKKIWLKAFVFILLAGFYSACNDTLIEETITVDATLKSAQSNKISYIVVLKDAELNAELTNIKGYEMRQQAAKKAAEKVLSRAAVSDGELGFVYSTALKGFSVKIPPGQLKKLENDPSVARIEADQVVTLIKPIFDPKAKPPGTPGGGGTEEPPAETSQEIPWGITRIGGAGDGTGKTAWIIDSGIDQDHPDLIVDTGRSKSFLDGKESTNPDDQNGHGTHVAGTIAAVNNTIGVVGVAPGAKVVSVRVLDRRGSGTITGVIAGVDYVAANAQSGDVANMSLGGGASTSLDDAVKTASGTCTFVLAAGNDGSNAANYSPARVNGTNIYTISAMNSTDLFASWSNWGNPPVDYCAPGVSIKSTWMNGGYNTISGTSMASPHAAGVLLLGNASTDGYVSGDLDSNPDPIIIH